MLSKKSVRLLLAALLTAGLGLAAEATAFAASPAKDATAATAKKKKKKPTVKLADSSLGKILVDSKGKTLYAFDPDGTNIDASGCRGGCAEAWPPYETTKKLRVGKGLDKSLLETGVDNQIAYNGHLLYHFSGDTAAGDTTGQGVGGIWHVVGEDGEPITS